METRADAVKMLPADALEMLPADEQEGLEPCLFYWSCLFSYII